MCVCVLTFFPYSFSLSFPLSSLIHVFLRFLQSLPSDVLARSESCYLPGDNHSKLRGFQTHNALFCSVPCICLLYTYLLSTSIKYFYSWNYTLLCYIILSFKHNYIWQVCEALKRKIRCKRSEWIETSIARPVDLSFVTVICDPVRGFWHVREHIVGNHCWPDTKLWMEIKWLIPYTPPFNHLLLH
jgi:hypothetical protein